MVVEAVASATRAGCYQGWEAHGSLAYQRALYAAHSRRCRSTTPSWAAEVPHVDSGLAVGPS